MRKVTPIGLIHRLFLFFTLCSPWLLQAPDAVTPPKFVTYSADTWNDSFPGTFGWKSLPRSSKSFSLTFKAIKALDQFISLKCEDGKWIDIVIGGWSNTHGAIHYLADHDHLIAGYWVCSDQKVLDSCVPLPGCTTIIPDVTNPVEYTMTLVQGLKAGEGLCRVVGKKQDGTVVKIIETSHQWFNQVFTSYSFKPWNGPVQIADDRVTLLDSPSQLKVANTNKYLQVTAEGVLQAVDQKPDVVSLVLHSDAADASKKVLFARGVNKYVVLKNLQQVDSDNLYSPTDSSSKIGAEETVIDPAAFGRQFIFEAEGAGVKIKNASGALTTYLRVDSDGFVRAFKADPTKANKYVAPISKAEASVFVLEEPLTQAPLNTGDIIAFKLQDGSYLAFDAFKRGGEQRFVRQNTIGLMDPSTHFKVLNYPSDWKERGFIALATYGYDAAADTGTRIGDLAHGVVASYDTGTGNPAEKNWPTRLWISNKNDTAVCSLECDAASASKPKISFGFRGQKVGKNTSNMPVEAVILKNVGTATPEGEYKFELVTALAPYQRLLEGMTAPASLPVQNIATATGVALTPANLYPWDIDGGLTVSAPYLEVPESLKRGFIATFESDAAADLNIGFAGRPWGDSAMGYCYGIMQLHAGATNNTECKYDKANVVNKQTPYGLNADKTQYSPDVVKFAAPIALPTPGVLTKYRLIANFQSTTTRKLALEYLGSDNLYHEIFSVPFTSDQNMPNPSVDQDGIKFLGFRCGSAGFTVKNLAMRELIRGQAGVAAPMTLDVAKADVANKFKAAFEAPSKSPEDWVGLVLLFKNYITLASALDKFTEPYGTPAQSLRDKAVALIVAALPGAPDTVKPMLQDLQAFLADIPTWLPDPATPPTPLANVGSGSCLAFWIADDLYLGVGADGKLGAVKTSVYDPAVHFSVLDYNLANGRMSIALGDSARKVPTSTEYLRAYQGSDQSLSLGLTQIPRAVDTIVNQNPAGTMSFGYAGSPVLSTPASLGLTSGGSVKNFSVLRLSTDRLQQDKCFNVKTDRKLAKGQISTDIFLWATNFKRGSPVFSAIDWDFYTKGLAAYALKAPLIADDWNSPVTDDIQKTCANLTPEVLVNGSCGATNAEFMQRVFAFVQSGAGITAAARDNLTKGWMAFAPLKAGSKIVLKSDAGPFLACVVIDNKNVLKMSGTSTLNPNTRFDVAEFNASAGTVVLKNSDGLYLVFDAALKDLILSSNRSELAVLFDAATKKIKLGSGGKFAQVDPVTGNVKITADSTGALSFTVQTLATTDNQLLSNMASDPLDVAVEQKLKPLFTTTTGKSGDDWQYLVSLLSSYIQTKLVTPEDFVAWGVRRAALSNISLKDDVIAFLTALSIALQPQIQAAQGAAKDSLQQVLTQCAQVVVRLQDIPTYVNRTGPLQPITGIAAQNTVALSVGAGLYLVPDGVGGLKAAATVPLDPAAQMLITAYDQQNGRAIFKVGEKYLDLAAAAPYGFVLKNTPRYVDVVCDTTVPTRFAFVQAGVSIALNPAKLGSLVTAEVQNFDVVGPLSGVQLAFKDMLAHMNSAPTADIVKGDIVNCFDPAFASLGSYSGDWLYFVQKFDAYLRFINPTIRLDGVQLSGVRGGSLGLKDYAARIFSMISAQYSSAPQEAQVAAQQALQWLSGGTTSPDVSTTASSGVFAVGDTVFMQTIAADAITKQKLTWNGDALLIAAQVPDVDKSMHFNVLAYDTAAQTVVFGNDSLVFDPTTATFVAKQIKDVQPLSLQTVSVGGVTYYYLKNAAGGKLAIGPSGGSFNSSGDLFAFTKIANKQLLIDGVSDPKGSTDFENGLAKFVAAFDASAADTASLSYVLNAFDVYCTKAAALPSWSTEKSSAGSTFKEYARLWLQSITKSPTYTGLTPVLNEKISAMLANEAAFVIAAAPVSAPVDSSSSAEGSSQNDGQSAYTKLDGNKGTLSDDLGVIANALENNRDNTAELTNVLNVLNTYLGAATQRFDWYAQGPMIGDDTPRDYIVGKLQRILDNDWLFTGLTDELKQKVEMYQTNAKNNAASYSAQMAMLDTYAKKLTKASDLTASSQLIVLLKNFITELLGIGIPPQLRTQVLRKIDMYFDKSIVPALALARIDAQKNSWNLLLFGLELLLQSGEATSVELLDEKMNAFEQVIIPRLKMLDVTIQVDAISNFLEKVSMLAQSVKKLVSDTKDARFARFVALVFTYVDFVLKQNAQDPDFTEDQKNTISKLQDRSHQIKVMLGIEQDAQAAPIVSPSTPAAPPVTTSTPAPSVQASSSQTQLATVGSPQSSTNLAPSAFANEFNTNSSSSSPTQKQMAPAGGALQQTMALQDFKV